MFSIETFRHFCTLALRSQFVPIRFSRCQNTTRKAQETGQRPRWHRTKRSSEVAVLIGALQSAEAEQPSPQAQGKLARI